jgi:protein-S-isoprenylcysteine O-methyltransferase Ste14
VVLGRNFFGGVKLKEGHELVKEGPYGWIRHPIYTAFLAIGIGFFLLTGNWLIGVTWLGGSLLVLFTRMNVEEEMMIAQFGDEYLAYRNQVGKLLPRIIMIRSQEEPYEKR